MLRYSQRPRPTWLRPLHYITGWVMVGLVLLLLALGLVSTLSIYGTLGRSQHLIAGLSVVLLVLLSAGSATQISPKRPWARTVHVSINIALLVAYAWVLFSGWQVVQKYSTPNRLRIDKSGYSKAYFPVTCSATLP